MGDRNQNEKKTLFVGVVCNHREQEELKKIAELIRRDSFELFFPNVRVGGIVCPDPSADIVAASRFLDVGIYPDVHGLLESCPHLNIVVDMTADPENRRKLREILPPEISLLDNTTAVVLWEIINLQEGFMSCKTDLSRTLDMMHAVIDQLDEDVLLLDTDRRIVDVNRNVYLKRGLTREELIGRHCRQVIEGGDKLCPSGKEGECPFSVSLRTGRKAEGIRTMVDDEGRVHYFRIYTYPLFDEAGETRHIVEIRRDITERTAMEKRLQQAERMAAIGELATYMAHEIRNPLFAIGGFANALLRSKSLDEPAREKVNIILEESNRLNSFLNGITNFARPIRSETGEFDASAVVEEVVRLLRHTFEKQQVTVETRLSPNLPRASADPELFKQCLLNVVKNSLESMSGGGILRLVTFFDQDFIVTAIEDSGEGIAEDVLDKVFSPFFSTRKSGTGIGLAMTKKIIEEFGGQIEIRSRVNEGTTVSLFLPAALAVSQ